MWDDRPGNCFLVLVGVKYFQMVEEIEERMKAIHDKLNPSDHYPVFPINENLKIINSVNLQSMDLYEKDYNLINEKIIKKSFLLCYHYRIISEEHALNKIKTNNWYIENNYSLKDLTNNQCKDITDITLKNKIN